MHWWKGRTPNLNEGMRVQSEADRKRVAYVLDRMPRVVLQEILWVDEISR